MSSRRNFHDQLDLAVNSVRAENTMEDLMILMRVVGIAVVAKVNESNDSPSLFTIPSSPRLNAVS